MTSPAYLTPLKTYAREMYGDEISVQDAYKSFADESDRGALILAATSVEDALEHALRFKMTNIKDDNQAAKEIFSGKGPIATYSDKTLIAYALGIIDRKGRNQIDVVREIRNACAHSRRPLTLEISVLLNAIKGALGEEFVKQLPDQSRLTIRTAFVMHCAALGHYVVTGQRLGPAADLSKASGPHSS